MPYSNSPNYRTLNLSKLGIADIPSIYYIRHKQHLEPMQPHYHKDCLEIGLCLRGQFVLENNNSLYNVVAGDLFINNPESAHRMLDYPKGTVLYGMLIRMEKEKLLRFTKVESSEIKSRSINCPRTWQLTQTLLNTPLSISSVNTTLCRDATGSST